MHGTLLIKSFQNVCPASAGQRSCSITTRDFNERRADRYVAAIVLTNPSGMMVKPQAASTVADVRDRRPSTISRSPFTQDGAPGSARSSGASPAHGHQMQLGSIDVMR